MHRYIAPFGLNMARPATAAATARALLRWNVNSWEVSVGSRQNGNAAKRHRAKHRAILRNARNNKV